MSTRPVRPKIGLGLIIAGCLLTLLLLIIVVYGYTARPGWIGVADKGLWDWLELLIVPLTLALAVFFLSNRAQRQRDLEQRELELAIESERAQAEALRAYLDQMSDLLVNLKLKMQPRDSPPITLAQARTLAVLRFLGRTRKAQPLRLVFNLGLINKDDPLLSLKTADLQAADLREISLFEVSLREADFRLANLWGADLSRSDLSWADLRGANLSKAVLTNASLAHANLLPYDRDDPDQLIAPHLLDGFVPSDLVASRSRRRRSILPWLDSAAPTPTRFHEAILQGADLRGAFGYGADLRDADLRDADLRDADLRDAHLRDADLSGADLSGAEVTEEQLAACQSLEGATMPNGQKYEDWLKNKEGRGEDGENSGPS